MENELKKKSYFEIKEELNNLFNLIEEQEGELTDEQAEQLAITRNDLDAKIRGYVYYRKNLDSSIENAKEMAALAKDHVTKLEKRIEKVNKTINDAILEFGEPVLKAKEPTGNFRLVIGELTLNCIKVKELSVDTYTIDETVKDMNDIYRMLLYNSNMTVDSLDEATRTRWNAYRNISKPTLKLELDVDSAMDVYKLIQDNKVGVLSPDCLSLNLHNASVKEHLSKGNTLDGFELLDKNSLRIR